MGWVSIIEDAVDRFNESPPLSLGCGRRPSGRDRTYQICPICDARVTRMEKHMRKVHPETIKAHPSNEVFDQRVPCGQCGALLRKDRLEKHRRKAHGPS